MLNVLQAQADFPTIRNLSSEDSPDSGSGEVSAEGFLCPQCMQGFRSPEDLQSHYVSKHSAGGPVANFADLKEEVRELQTTLKVSARSIEVTEDQACKVSFPCRF